MRLTNLLTLFAAATSLVYADNSMQKRGLPDVNDSSISSDCKNIMVNFSSCFNVNENSSNEESCKQYNSSKCQDFLNKSNSACGEEMKVVIEAFVATFKVACAKDESGKFCPQAKVVDNNVTLTDSELQEICKSKSCKEKALEGFKKSKEAAEQLQKFNPDVKKEIPGIEKYINYLNGDKCKAASTATTSTKSATGTSTKSGTSTSTKTASAARNATSTETPNRNPIGIFGSGATQVKVGSALFATLVVLALNVF